MRWSIESRITIGFIVSLTLIVIIGVLVQRNAVQFLATTQDVNHTLQVLNEIDEVLLSITTAESEARAFLITDDPHFLGTFDDARTAANEGLQSLRELTHDNPIQQQNLDELDRLVSARIEILSTAIDNRIAENASAAEEPEAEPEQLSNQQISSTPTPGPGRIAMASVRDATSAMKNVENMLLFDRAELAQVRGQTTILAMTVLTVLIGAMLLLVYYFIRRDITGRRRSEAALAAERNLLQTLMDNLPDAVYIKDTESRFITNNKSHQRLMGAPDVSKVIGTTDFEWFPKELATLYYEGEQNMFRTGNNIINREDPVIDAEKNEAWYLSTKVLLRDPNKQVTGFVGISRDITEHKRRADEIARLNRELEASVRDLTALNKELEAFSYSVSHDLRAPLRAMSGFSRIVEEEYAELLPQEAMRYLGIVRTNAEQMGELIDGLLTFSRLSRQPLTKQRVEMVELARHVAEELHDQQNGREMEIIIADDLPACQADPILLRQVYANLIGNAFKFTKNRVVSRIEIGWHQREDNTSEYFIKDNGAGFDIQYANKLFGVFQRLHRADEFEGTGVGLAIVQRILHRHGGSIRAEAEVDKGAAFYFTVEGKSE